VNQVTIKDLAPEGRAVLSLLLTQGRTYEQIAEVLKIDDAGVRSRAHAAADELAGDERPTPSPATRALIADYLLGQQSHSERVRTCYALAASNVDRDWARRLARGIAPLSKVPLPVIPGAGPRRQPAAKRVEPRPTPGSVPRRGTIIAALVAAGAAAAVVAIVLATSGGSSPAHPAAALPNVVRTRGTSKIPARTLHRIVLLPAGADKHAFGAGAILSQGASMLLLLQARGLQPNNHNSYGVWLFNAPGDARLLGFVSPPVGHSGTFSSGTTLPSDAVRFHSVIVTRETKANPSAPGSIVLRASLPFG
jgi:hypothetical protein